ncbi:MAG: hypothetical protein GY915_01620 [bacterium]|nr:hypothetical protein [bacterium]
MALWGRISVFRVLIFFSLKVLERAFTGIWKMDLLRKKKFVAHVLEAHFLWHKKRTRETGKFLYSLLNSWKEAGYGAPSKRSRRISW